MSSLSIGHDWPVPRNQIEILVVESDPADTRLSEEALVDSAISLAQTLGC